ncbi:MAG: Eco57I restriction-modification methylase domain-containing protein [Chloroflexi bacterium]|nr:Eco57I restriction-modification methylase domain-containing protein [Chloroflexota bacterium]
MSTSSIRNAISAALRTMVDSDLTAAASNLLSACGYRSERTLPDQSGDADDFIQQFPAVNAGTQSEQAFVDNAESVQLLFQFTGGEIQAETQRALFDAAGFDTGNARSFLFAAVQLRGDAYPRGQYATFTRELNKRFPMPMVVLFRTAANLISLAFVHRRPNKRDPERDVLGSVSLIREIDPAKQHRAHLDILAELSLPERLKWMNDRGKPHNFDGLLDAWLAALDTEELNRRFYQDLFQWFERAVSTASFPTGKDGTLPAEEHVIRLITRLMFVWFIQEKGLAEEDLFIEEQVRNLLKDYDREGGDSYYRAVLQNLFFATLNTEIGQRRFSRENRDDHRDFSVYRYRSEIADPDRLLDLFGKTPFINGGLFDCLDSFDATGAGGVRVDCFTDNPGHRAGYSIPNRLFFGDNASPGLIDLFNRYKFTVEENTPTEQEVALDPELLGKVFENLLAAVNPETQQTARKETGSYYTPRAVVDYMVDEALVATLAHKASPEDGDADYWQARLRYLLDYGDAFADAETLFTPAERKAVVGAIAGIKALDPAVGSGAFPMGILHKLTLALRRLDDRNQLWESLQKGLAGQRATATFDTQDPEERESELSEISRTFEKYRDSDFGRKLYLIQNSIYGVDIQPIATQIAKLRFFISLAIEQQPNKDKADNYGIRPLPNLETRFVAADTLLALDSSQGVLTSPRARELQSELRQNRERYFHANNRSLKLRYRDEDQRLRGELAAELRQIGMAPGDAGKIAACDLFDQNTAAANWFDAEYMFGVTDGFDVVMGNPPYVESRNSLLSDEMKDAYIGQVLSDWGERLPRGSDLLMYFLARSPKLLNDRGHGYLITQNAWLSTDYGKRFQDFSLGKFSVYKIVDTSAKFFSDSNGPQINAVVVVFGNRLLEEIEYDIVDESMEKTTTKTFAARQTNKWGHLAAMPEFFIDMIAEMAERAGPKGNVSFGQGLNFPLKELDQARSTEPVIVKSVNFVATAADGRVRSNHISSTRRGKIPALIMPRGVGDRYYCTFNACKAFSYSGVELYLPDSLWESDLHYCLWVYLNSSLAWLFREITGRRNLGGGLLKAEATDLKTLPVSFDFDFADEAKEVFSVLRGRSPLPVAQEVHTDEHLAIDQMVFDFLGYSEQQDDIREQLLELVAFRTSRSSRYPTSATQRRAMSVSGGASSAGATRESTKPQFQVVPNHSGLAPGVTADNLKDIIHELEEEEFLENMGL